MAKNGLTSPEKPWQMIKHSPVDICVTTMYPHIYPMLKAPVRILATNTNSLYLLRRGDFVLDEERRDIFAQERCKFPKGHGGSSGTS